MIKGFKEFIMRGNVVELAIAVVIGTAFAEVVKVFISSIVKPILNTFSSGSVRGLGFHLKYSDPTTFIDLSAIINSLIVFLMTALVVYLFFVMPMNKLAERKAAKRKAAGIVDDPEPPSEAELLTEIRDLLRSKQ